MFTLIKELFSLFSPSQKRRYFKLQIMVVLMAIMELFGIASIGPFMALVADPGLVHTNALYKMVYQIIGCTNPNDFLFLSGLFVLVMLAFSSIISIFTSWRLALFSYDIGTEIGDRLYQYYLSKNWLFHANHNSAQLTKQISTEANRVTNNIVLPFMQMNARAVLALFISIAIIIYNPLVAIVGLFLFISGYIILYRQVRSRVLNYGRNVSRASTERYRLMNEGFGGIKDILLSNRRDAFLEDFEKSGDLLAKAQGRNKALSETPKFFMELIAFGAMIGLVLVLVKLFDGVLSMVLPVLAVYALAGFKLLPALQQIYASTTTIKSGVAAFESIKEDLLDAQRINKIKINQEIIDIDHIKNIIFENVSFTYPTKKDSALKNLNISIPMHSVVGFVGESGSGKSTAVDVLLGLIEPDIGTVKLDAIPITEANTRSWQQYIGFVPQSIFLSEGSIAENIAFGLRKKEIDLEKVKKAVHLAHMDDFVSTLPNGLDTKVGERGVRLSGGQRQRIGIARALYNEAKILVFDEATSSLDGITEKIIMDAIHELSGNRTIILIAHRLKTIQNCDVIYMMEDGTVVDQGAYSELVHRNEHFKQMAQYA